MVDVFNRGSWPFAKTGCGDPVLLSRGAKTALKDWLPRLKLSTKYLERMINMARTVREEATRSKPIHKSEQDKPVKRRPPATTPEARENQLIALAIDVAEEQMLKRTASSQVIAHFLKIASSKERLEKELLQQQKELMKAKMEAIQSAKNVEELYGKALNAMRTYSGQGASNDED